MNSKYPSIEDLKAKAKQRMPGFAYDYLSGGCFSEVNLERNTKEIRDVQLNPVYLRDYNGANLETELFGERYSAPFGVAPVGLQGLMWPKSCEILAEAANQHNLPFVLSTVGTSSMEEIAKITKGKFWFQLYHPAENELRDKLLERLQQTECKTLVLLADTPTFAYRPKEIKNGLSIPPKMSLKNVLQMLKCPQWCMGQLLAGIPEFKTMKPYIPEGLNMKHLGLFMNKTFSGRLTPDRIKAIRDKWKGNLVIKGVVNPEDLEIAIQLGADGVIVSNHGGRQLDSGESTIKPLKRLTDSYTGKIKIMMDSGIRSGSDVAASMASGADFTFLGRSPMYGVAALGQQGGDHTMTILKRQLLQVMEQIGCSNVHELKDHLLKQPVS